mmetsp:Transcript_16567/g.29960  ORF Transcript_16567/g.29960 Transcript_16567/m.29960 type:complete len:428 (-) Transcript_16567:66-1349(-)
MSAIKRFFKPKQHQEDRAVALSIGSLDFTPLFPSLTASSPQNDETNKNHSDIKKKNVSKSLKSIFKNISPAQAKPHDIPYKTRTQSSEFRHYIDACLTQHLNFKNVDFYDPATDIYEGPSRSSDGPKVSSNSYKERLLHRLSVFFSKTRSRIILVHYCGSSDEHGNWIVPTGTKKSEPFLLKKNDASVTLTPDAFTFDDLVTLWKRHHHEGKRLVLILDCVGSGVWVDSLRKLSKNAQLQLDMCIQAADTVKSASDPIAAPLRDNVDPSMSFVPGHFTNIFFRMNVNICGGDASLPPLPPYPSLSPPLNPSATSPSLPRIISIDNEEFVFPTTASSVKQGGEREDDKRGRLFSSIPPYWPSVLTPSFYATWMTGSVMDYGVPVRFVSVVSSPVSLKATSERIAKRGGEEEEGEKEERERKEREREEK